MSVICSNCGNTKHKPGARTCTICGAPLPAPIALSPMKAGAPIASFPMLVTASGRRYRLNDTADTLIGSRGCAITLTDPDVSARHARVFPAGGGFAIEDLGGGTKVNGQPIKAPYPLQPGDTIVVGQASLVYQGPPAAPGVLQPQPSPPPPPAVQPPRGAITPPPMAPAMPPLQPRRPAVPLKVWGQNPPATEGEVVLIDGPHMMDKGNMGGKLAAAAALGLLTRGALAFLPFMGRHEIPVWFLRINDFHTGQNVSVLMGGQPSSLPQMGDVIAVWGQVKEGNVIMERGYSYATNSEIRLKR